LNFTKHQTNAKLALQRAAAARRVLFRLPTGADDELQNDELQTDLPAEVTDRSSYRTANGIPEMPGPPASNYMGSWRALYCSF
jgi:hypothetical protein